MAAKSGFPPGKWQCLISIMEDLTIHWLVTVLAKAPYQKSFVQSTWRVFSDWFSYSRSSLMETMFDFRSVRLRGSIRDITKHFPLNFFHELGQTASKSKFKPLPENKYIFASMFSFNILKAKYFSLSKNWSFWQRLDESLNFCCWVVNKPTIFRESIFW